MRCYISECPDEAVCVAQVKSVLGKLMKAYDNHHPMCAFHCGYGHGRPAVCRPV